MKRIYIAGKISGDKNYYKKFLAEEDRLYDLGYEPVNPAAIIEPNVAWPEAMKIAIGKMLSCDGVSLLPDWKKSRGAKIEERLARELGMDLRPSGQWQKLQEAACSN